MRTIDFDANLYQLKLVLRRADCQRPMADVMKSSPTPSERDDWWLYNKMLEDDYHAQNDSEHIYAARKRLEEIDRKERVQEEQKQTVRTSHPNPFLFYARRGSQRFRFLRGLTQEHEPPYSLPSRRNNSNFKDACRFENTLTIIECDEVEENEQPRLFIASEPCSYRRKISRTPTLISK